MSLGKSWLSCCLLVATPGTTPVGLWLWEGLRCWPGHRCPLTAVRPSCILAPGHPGLGAATEASAPDLVLGWQWGPGCSNPLSQPHVAGGALHSTRSSTPVRWGNRGRELRCGAGRLVRVALPGWGPLCPLLLRVRPLPSERPPWQQAPSLFPRKTTGSAQRTQRDHV